MIKQENRKRYIMYYCFCCVFFMYFVWHVIICYDTMPQELGLNTPVIDAFVHAFERIEKTPFDVYITKSFLAGMMYGLLTCVLCGLALFSIQRKMRIGEEQGSARFATDAEKRKLMDDDYDRNMIFCADVLISMNTRKTRLNNNVLVVGGSGSGKTRFFAKPNILQCNCSFCITDPKGELLRSTGKVLEEEGYIIKCFNLIEKHHSCCYNPFQYIHKESDVFKMITQLIKNTTPPNSQSSDPFWEKSETALLEAIFFYLWLECPKEEQNFKSVMNLINIADASEDDETRESRLDAMFRILGERKGEDYIPVKQYNIYRKASGKTAKSILISVGVRLSVFNLKDIENLTITDTLHLDEIGDRKTVLYIVIPDSDPSFNFLVSMMYSQLFDELYFQADFGELKWNNDKILYHSPESLTSKKNELIRIYKEYQSTLGELRRIELRQEFEGVLKAIEKEFGLGYKTLPKELTKKYLLRHIDNIDSQILRIRDRTVTLRRYCTQLTEIYNSLRVLYKRNKDNRFTFETKITDKMTLTQRKEIKVLTDLYKLELRLEKEYGVKRLPDKKKILFLSIPLSSKERLERLKALYGRAKMLLKEMENSEFMYGTKRSFHDKIDKIKELKLKIEEDKKLLKTFSKRQTAYIDKTRKEIKKYENQIQNINLIAEYEFGVPDIEKRHMNGGRLPIHVRCILDEFANIAPIPDFAKLIATMRSREISVSIIIQAQSQLKTMFKDDHETIIGNCDHFLFLGGSETSTLESVSKKIGKETIDKRSQGRSKGRQGSSSENWDVLGRELMMENEVAQLPNDECILFVRGRVPFRSKKFPLEKHKRYNRMGETDNPNDPRLFDFHSAFNTMKIAKGMDENRIIMNGEYKSIIKRRINSYIKNFDAKDACLYANANSIFLIHKSNVSSVRDMTAEKEKQKARMELFARQTRIEVANALNNMGLQFDITDESTHSLFRNTIIDNTSGRLQETTSEFALQSKTVLDEKAENPSLVTPYQQDRESAEEQFPEQTEAEVQEETDNASTETENLGETESVETASTDNESTSDEGTAVPTEEFPTEEIPQEDDEKEGEENANEKEDLENREWELKNLLQQMHSLKKNKEVMDSYLALTGEEQKAFSDSHRDSIQEYKLAERALVRAGINSSVLGVENRLQKELEDIQAKLRVFPQMDADACLEEPINTTSPENTEERDFDEANFVDVNKQNPLSDSVMSSTSDMGTFFEDTYNANHAVRDSATEEAPADTDSDVTEGTGLSQEEIEALAKTICEEENEDEGYAEGEEFDMSHDNNNC